MSRKLGVLFVGLLVLFGLSSLWALCRLEPAPERGPFDSRKVLGEPP